MREALVQDAQHEVDDDDRRQENDAEPLQRILEGLRRALKTRRHGGRQRVAGQLLNGVHRVAERDARPEVEGDGD